MLDCIKVVALSSIGVVGLGPGWGLAASLSTIFSV